MDWCPDYAPNLLAWDGNGHLIASGFEAARSALWSLDPVKGTVTRILLEDSYRSGLASAPGSSVIVQNRGSATATAELVVTDTTTGRSTPLTQLNTAWFESHRPGSIEQHEVTNEGFSVSFLLKTPHDFDPSRTYPVVFEIHGGPHMFRGYDIETSNQLLLDAGYLVVCPNPRGSISWGLEYTKGVLGDWGGGDWRDILAVVDEVAAMPFVDQTRLGIYGYSYGGYMSSWAIGQTDRFKAAVIGAPLTDLISRDGTSDIGYAASWLEYNGELPDIREMLVRQSPVTHMHKAVTPTLILHPEDDQRCPIGQGEQLFVGLKRAGVETEFVRYPDESHLMPWYGPAEYRIDFYTRILDWFGKYL
jgi:dipeptidyl aminopeptidase/acylaminoacyl peptidase